MFLLCVALYETLNENPLYGERLARIWTKLEGNSSCKPPGDSYIAQGPYIIQRNEKMRKRHFYKNHKFSSYIPFLGPIGPCLSVCLSVCLHKLVLLVAKATRRIQGLPLRHCRSTTPERMGPDRCASQ